MFNEFIGKNCEISVAFATSLSNGGLCNITYSGVLLEDNPDFIKVDVSGAKVGFPKSFPVNKFGLTIINKKYVVSINLI